MHRTKLKLTSWEEHENGRKGEENVECKRKITLHMYRLNIMQVHKCKTKNPSIKVLKVGDIPAPWGSLNERHRRGSTILSEVTL